MMGAESATVVDPPGKASKDAAPAEPLRARALVEQNLRFIWRTLRRLGVQSAELPDATQQVFTVAARRIEIIQEGCERAFLYQTAIRVASDFRRAVQRRREDDDAILHEHPDGAAGPEELLDRARARALLDQVLEQMPMDLRTVFVLFELEEMTMAEIAAILDVPLGTIASRLRRAREQFQVTVRQVRARGAGR